MQYYILGYFYLLRCTVFQRVTLLCWKLENKGGELDQYGKVRSAEGNIRMQLDHHLGKQE